MSKLTDLIHSLCPEGVPRVELGTFAKHEKGKNGDRHCELAYSITKQGLMPTSEYFKDAKVTSEDTSGYRIVKRNWFVYSPSRIDVGSINYLRDADEVIVSPLNVVFSVDQETIDPEYLLTYLNSKEGTWQILTNREGIEGTGRKLLPFEKFSKITVPVPPLEIQHEVIRVLRYFMELISELRMELNARNNQYSYYSEAIFDDLARTSPILNIEEVVLSLNTGLNPRKNFKLNEPGSCYPYITGKDIFNNQINVGEKTDYITPEALAIINKRAKLEPGILLFASTGTGTVGRMAVIDAYNNDWGMSETLFGIKLKEDLILPYYLMYFLYSPYAKEQFEPKISKGSVPHLKVKDLMQVKIPVPDINIQRSVIEKLKVFDCICNNLAEGLPAEINARQKQYEFYRDTVMQFNVAIGG